MKQYIPCEVEILFYETEDVITASPGTIDGFTNDPFDDDNWYEVGSV